MACYGSGMDGRDLALAGDKALMADEIELKLELTREAADRVEASGLLAGEPQKAQQRSIYFDTPDRDLAKAGVSLRIRRSGRKRIQTVKAGGAGVAGLFARSEWERPVKDDTPILDEATPIAALPGDAAAAVTPVFQVEIERRSWLIVEGDTVIELVLDRGAVVAGERRSPICEIELELKSGDPAALFAFARRIDAVAPVRLGVLTKAERGFRLTRPAVTMAKADPVALADDATAAQAFRQIVGACLRQFRLNEALLLADRDPGALHQARVALRRLRSAFAVFKPMLDDGAADLRKELGWLASGLGAARNLDVLLDRAGAGPLRDHIMVAREAAYDRVAEMLSQPRARRLPFDLAAWAACVDAGGSSGGEADLSARAFAAGALGRLRRKVKRKGRDLTRIDDTARHAVRKQGKTLRYAAEFFASLFEHKRQRERRTRFVAALEGLQEQLGALNDLATAPELLEKLGIANDPEAPMLLVKGRRKLHLKAAQDAYAKLVDAKRFWR